MDKSGFPMERGDVSSGRSGPVLVGVAESGQLEGYYVEVWRAEVEGWDIFYFNPVLREWEFNSYAEDWGEAMEYGEAQGVRWCGGSGWVGDGAGPSEVCGHIQAVEEKEGGGERDRHVEMLGIKILLLAVGFGVPLVVMQYFLVETRPWLYVPFVFLMVLYFWCVHRIGGWGGRSEETRRGRMPTSPKVVSQRMKQDGRG